MAPRGGVVFLLFLLTGSVLAMHPHSMLGNSTGFPALPPQFKGTAKKLMMKCLHMGHRVPMMPEMEDPFNKSSIQATNQSSPEAKKISLLFLSIMSELSAEEGHGPDGSPANGSSELLEVDNSEIMNEMENCTHLPCLLKLSKDSSVQKSGMACFLRTFLAALSWEALQQGAADMDLDDYRCAVWAAKPFLDHMPPDKINLPVLPITRSAIMMEMLKDVFDRLSKEQRKQVKKWIFQSYFNCSGFSRKLGRPRPKPMGFNPFRPYGGFKPLRPNPGNKPHGPLMYSERPQSDLQVQAPAGQCPPDARCMDTTMMKMMGPFCEMDDFNSIPRDELCEFFRSDEFKITFRRVKEIHPIVARRIFQRFRRCSQSEEEFTGHLGRLGILACYYEDAPRMNASMSQLLLFQLDNCSNYQATKLKRSLCRNVMRSSDQPTRESLLMELAPCMNMLSPKNISKFPTFVLKNALEAAGPIIWKMPQARKIIKKFLPTIKEWTCKELSFLGSAVRAIPYSKLRMIKVMKSMDRVCLSRLSRWMSKGQKKTLVGMMNRNANAAEIVDEVPDNLLPSLSLATLAKASVPSLDSLAEKRFNYPQSVFLVSRLMRGKPVRLMYIRRLGSAMQGLTCKMIDRIADGDSKAMAQTVAETPQWFSTAQVNCAARKYFSSLEKERPGYFQRISVDELNDIPVIMLIHLPPRKIRLLPDSVCPVFLEKMSDANLTSLPPRAPQRSALTSRALRCQAKEGDLKELSIEKVLELGPLLCELSPNQLKLMSPETRNLTLQAMASCAQIPPHHRVGLVKLLISIYGNPSDWSFETMETFVPLLAWDANTIRALSYKTWLKSFLSDLMDSQPCLSMTFSPIDSLTCPDGSIIKEKLFNLSTESSGSRLTGARRKREATDQALTSPATEMCVEAHQRLTSQQISEMTPEAFDDATETLGELNDYSSVELEQALRKKVIEACGDVEQLDELGCISQSFTPSELENLRIGLADNLDGLSSCKWTQQQREAVWRGIKRHKNVTADIMEAAELTQLDQFICGFSPEEIASLNSDAFKEAVDMIGDIQCPLVVLESLKERAVDVFGPVSQWTEARVIAVGYILAGMSADDLRALDPFVFSSIRPDIIALIPPKRFSELKVIQLKSLGPLHASVVTDAQRAALDEEKETALESALGVSLERATTNSPEPVPQSGAPILNGEGMGDFVKPLLFFFLGLFLV